MKLLQLNMWWGGKLDGNILRLLKSEQPDILCLQEAVSFNAANSGPFLSIENIKETLGIKDLTFSPMFSFNFMQGVAVFGNAILSHFPITKEESVYTNLQHMENFDFNKHDYNVRAFSHTLLDVDNKPCHVLTHHGFHVPEHKNGNEETLRQMKMLADYIGALEGPVILTGDFNLAPHSPSLEQLNGMLRNLSIEYGLKTTRSNLTHKTEVCDYIFVNDKVKVDNFAALDETVSDHQALKLEFNI